MRRIAIMGGGTISRKAALALIEDYYDSTDEVKRLVLPIMSDNIEDIAPVVGYAARWALNLNVDYDVVVPNGFDATSTTVAEIVEGAVAVHRAAKVSVGITRILQPGDELLLAWDDEDRDCMRALVAADRQGIVAKDICDGLTDLVIGNVEEDEETLDREVVGDFLAPLQGEIVDRIGKEIRKIFDMAYADILDSVRDALAEDAKKNETKRTDRPRRASRSKEKSTS